MSKKNQKIEIPDVFGQALIDIINEEHKNKNLITGFVLIIETYNGKKKKLKVVPSPEMTEYQTFGMLNYANINFEYATPDDDDWDDDDYDPHWYEGQ